MAVKLFDTEGKDTREQARFHVKMIMGTRHVTIVDTKYKPLTRAMKLDVSPRTVSEVSFREIFEDVVEALHETGNMASDESAACITFPAGTIQIEVPFKGQA
jgi:hypothetical protein